MSMAIPSCVLFAFHRYFVAFQHYLAQGLPAGAVT
jgi:hypothetical protein